MTTFPTSPAPSRFMPVVRFIHRFRFPILLVTAVASLFTVRKPSGFSGRRICADSFFIFSTSKETDDQKNEWPCFTKTPKGFKVPGNSALWRTPRANIGKLDLNSSKFKLYVKSQGWANLGNDSVNIEEHGGSGGRAFDTNFHYVRTLNESLNFNERCGEKPTMLDMGGGIASVAAAFLDERGLNGSMRVLTYTQSDEFLRLQSIINDRGLPSFILDFKRITPFPSESFDYVHCKWCWHWLAGYDVWLKEVDRLLIPGGYFIFTLSTGRKDLLIKEDWEKQVKHFGFRCLQAGKRISLCQKAGEIENSCADESSTEIDGVRFLITQVQTELKMNRPRLLNLHCPDASLCAELEQYFSMTLHISEEVYQIKQLNLRRRLAMVHDFSINLPTYPRTYDVVNIGCGARNGHIFRRESYWVDLHRVLRPGGAVLLMKLFCKRNFEDQLVKAMFRIKHVSQDVLIAWRIEVPDEQ